MKNLCPVIIWGASGHALVVADIVRQLGIYKIAGYLDDVNSSQHGKDFAGGKILGGRERLDEMLAKGIKHIYLAFGDCKMRLTLSEMLISMGFLLPTAIHPKTIIASDVTVGPGTVITAGAVVNPGAKIGRSVIINTAATVGHECVVDDFAHIGPGAHLAGRVTIGKATHIAIGAAIIDGIKIGHRTVIGAGAVVVNDIPNDVIAYGVPARIKGDN